MPNTIPTRRHVLTSTAAAAAGLTILKPAAVRAANANERIRLGLIGCGGRGRWIADLFKAHGGYELTAVADYFQDRADGVGEAHGVATARRFTGLKCYQRLIDAGGVDAVAIISPPYFHPEQAAAAVDAGLHVYLAKPIAVDAPGCRSIADTGKRATAGKQVLLVDFQTRAQPLFVEAVERVHRGDMGEICFGEASYHTGRLGIQTPPGTPEARLRNWVFDIALSGDIITEQNIHTLDVMSWVMDQPPVSATGTCGRKVRTDVGDCNDHFALVFEYPGRVGVTFSSSQFNSHGTRQGIFNRFFGTQGTLDTEYGGTVILRGDNPYRGGRTTQIYQEGAENNIKAFCDHIHQGRYDNGTVAPSVRSNLVTILGRQAAYTGRTIRWEEIVKSDERLDGDLRGLRA